MDLIYEGTCWKFGDNISVDSDMTKKEFSTQRETRHEILRDYLMCGIDPDFAKKVAPHDIIVAGKRFAQGNPHIQGLIGIAANQMGLVCESIQRGSYRNAINAGVPFISHATGVTQTCETGDRLRVNFSTGTFENLTQGTVHQYTPLSDDLLETVKLGGWKPMVKLRLQKLGLIPA